MMSPGTGWSIPAVVILIALLVATAAGCGESNGDLAADPTPTPAPAAPSPTPTATTVTESRAWNITRELSGLDITLAVVHWTGDDLLVEWVIANPTGPKFAKSYLSDIFAIGAVAEDQDGNPGEYFIPEPFKLNLEPRDVVPYETKWRFYPESKTITLRLWDLREPVEGSFVDANVEYVISR